MAFGINKSYLAATVVLIGIGAWMGTGAINVGGQAAAATGDSAKSISERKEGSDNLFAVRVVTLNALDYQRQIELRGRTKADSKVSVRAETKGIIQERLVKLGQKVSVGDMLCRLDQGSREAQLLQAKASFQQAKVDFDANESLQKRGFAATNQVAAMRAVFDAAAAQLSEAELEFKRTEIRATVAGIVQEPLAERGDLLRTGDVCATIIDSDPIIVTGQISERFVDSLSNGMEAAISVITGVKRKGVISYVSTSADAATRTFRVDIDVPNTDESLRDGVTAIAHIPLPAVKAHLLAPSMLTLSDDGVLGVRVVDPKTNSNKFVQIAILGESADGLWVGGLPPEVTVIMIGQEYVIDDQIVDPVAMETAQ